MKNSSLSLAACAGAALYYNRSVFRAASLYGLTLSLLYSSACCLTSSTEENEEYYSKNIWMSSAAVFTNLACYYAAYYIPKLPPFVTSDAFTTIASCVVGGSPYTALNSCTLVLLAMGANQVGLKFCINAIEPLLGKMATILPNNDQIKMLFDHAIDFYNNHGGRVALNGFVCNFLISNLAPTPSKKTSLDSLV